MDEFLIFEVLERYVNAFLEQPGLLNDRRNRVVVVTKVGYRTSVGTNGEQVHELMAFYRPHSAACVDIQKINVLPDSFLGSGQVFRVIYRPLHKAGSLIVRGVSGVKSLPPTRYSFVFGRQ